MSEVYSFTVHGKPQPKERPRVTRYSTRTPDRTRAYEARVALAAWTACPQQLAGPVRVDILIVLARPKKLHRKRDPEGLMWAPVRPDADNVRKAILDGLDGGVLKDDGQVVAGSTFKVYSGKGGTGRVEVCITTLGAEQPSAAALARLARLRG